MELGTATARFLEMATELNYRVLKKKSLMEFGQHKTVASWSLLLEGDVVAKDRAREFSEVGNTRGFEELFGETEHMSCCFLNLARICLLCQMCAKQTFIKLGGFYCCSS